MRYTWKQFVAVGLLSLAGATSVSAESMKFGVDHFHVVAAKSFLDLSKTPNGAKFIQLDLRQGIRWPIEVSKIPPDFAKEGFQIRFFRLDENDKIAEYGPPFTPCHIYITSRWRDLRAQNGALVIGALKDPSWLTPHAGQKMTAGRWLIVFESMKDDDDVLRLNEHALNAYFDMGIILVVTSDNSFDTDKLPTTNQDEVDVLRTIQKAARDNIPAYPCMELATAAIKTQVAELQACAVPPREASPSALQSKDSG